MENVASETIEAKKQEQTGTPHKYAAEAAIAIGGCACGTFVLGAVLNAPWPGAVAACGLCLMGVGVAFVIMRRA